MRKKTYQTISVIAGVIAVIGLFSLIGGIHPVNVGIFLFPAVISVVAGIAYKRK